jgi:hypothetical protein
MNVQFDWQVGDKQDQWATIATTERHSVFSVSLRVWRTLLLAMIVVALAGTLGVRYRYQVALRRLKSDIQAAIELEARALDQRDRDLYMAQQDEALPHWYWRQAVRFTLYRDPCESSRPGSSPWAAPGTRQEGCVPDPRPVVQEVRLRGNVAWVQVVEGLPPVLRARFYRQTPYVWVHTAPRLEFWADPVERRYGSVTVRAQPYDLAYVEPLVEHMARVVDEVSAALGDGGSQKLEVVFAPPGSPGPMPALKEGVLILASPWSTGVPADGAWDPEVLDTLEYWAVYGVTSRYVQPADGRASGGTGSLGPADSLSPLQKALVDEYAVLYSRGDVAQAPILSQILAQHGPDVLREMLGSLREAEDTRVFLSRWFFAAPASEEVYLNTLAGIRRKALLAGREDTCALARQVLASHQALDSQLVAAGDDDFWRERFEREKETVCATLALAADGGACHTLLCTECHTAERYPADGLSPSEQE